MINRQGNHTETVIYLESCANDTGWMRPPNPSRSPTPLQDVTYTVSNLPRYINEAQIEAAIHKQYGVATTGRLQMLPDAASNTRHATLRIKAYEQNKIVSEDLRLRSQNSSDPWIAYIRRSGASTASSSAQMPRRSSNYQTALRQQPALESQPQPSQLHAQKARLSNVEITRMANAHQKYRGTKEWSAADESRRQLQGHGIELLEDEKEWRHVDGRHGSIMSSVCTLTGLQIMEKVLERKTARQEKDWARGDAIQNGLLVSEVDFYCRAGSTGPVGVWLRAVSCRCDVIVCGRAKFFSWVWQAETRVPVVRYSEVAH